MKTNRKNRATLHTMTDQRELIDWLAEKAKASEPQADITKGTLRMFEIVVSEFRDYGKLEVPWDWGEWFDLNYYHMYDGDTCRCSANVSWLATNAYAELIKGKVELDCEYFIHALVDALDLTLKIEFLSDEEGVRVHSNERFHTVYGFRVRVLLCEIV